MASYDNLNSTRNTPQPGYGSGSSPYGSGDPYYNESVGYITPQRPPTKQGTSKWLKIGVPVGIVVVIAAVVGIVVGIKHHSSDSSSSSSSGSGGASGGNSNKALAIFPTATNSQFMIPIYPQTSNTAFSTPTFNPSSSSKPGWPADSFKPASPNPTTVRPDRPRLIAPSYKWAALSDLIATDPYMKSWNDTIFGNASDYYNLPPVIYFMDGDSGILDNARDLKRRIKAFSYVYRMTNDTKWVDRAFLELQNAAGNTSNSFGPDNSTRWNPAHFLDTAEFSAAYGIAYDWLYDVWTPTQKSQIMSSLITYGLSNAIEAYGADPLFYGWWKSNIEGNWNCVCNNGITMASLAILGDDTTGYAQQLLAQTVPNAAANCAFGVSSDGTWSETSDYWYFAVTGHSEMAASLLSATGSTYGLLSSNPWFNQTADFHIYGSGATTLFNYGDTGPNKYSSTANSLIFYASQYNIPRFSLFQRDQYDAAEPWSMFWYDPTVSGAWWDGLPLDRIFDNSTDQWISSRSSFTDENALFFAMKAGTNQGHQTHNDLDCGDFIIDALGTRWAGELGDGDYRSTGYFSNDTQESDRWLYYRKATMGQNVILANTTNQNVAAAPTIIGSGTTGEAQGASSAYTPPSTSAAYFVADITTAYFGVTSYSRGIRSINGRKQILLQDEINTQVPIMWRMHTNATVSIASGNTTATLKLSGQTMTMQLLNAPSGAAISTMPAVRFPTDPATPAGYPDQPNDGVTVVTVSLPAGTYQLQMLFNPQWNGMSSSDYKTPSYIPLSSWSTTSHP